MGTQANLPPLRDAPRVLIVEDDRDLCDSLSGELEHHGFSVSLAHSGATALDELRGASKPDVILLDLMMPGMSGWQFREEQLKLEGASDIPVIVMTASRELRDIRADEVVFKPLKMPALLDLVRRHVEAEEAAAALHTTPPPTELDALLGSLPAAVNYLRGPELVFEYVHPLTRRAFGDRAVLGRPLAEALPDLGDPDLPALLRGVIETGVPLEGTEKPVRRRDGAGRMRETWWNFKYVPVRGATGRVEGVLTYDLDVTAQVAARRAVERSEEKYRRIVRQVRAGISECDASGRLTFANEHFRAFTGRDEAALLRLRLQDLLHPGDAAQHGARLARFFATGEPYEEQLRLVRPDGSGVWLQAFVSRGDDGGSGPPTGATLLTLDVTQRNADDGEREGRLEEAQRTLEFSETFVGVLGHDLRTPLSAIATSVDSLLRVGVDERLGRPLKRIRGSVDRMTRMIEQVLDFTRARLGRGIPLHRRPLDLRVLVEQLVDEVQSATSQAIELTVRGDTVGAWDGDRLAQVLQNLLGNALQHGSALEPVRVDLDGCARDELVLTVWNPGAMSEAVRSQVFAPFKRPGIRSGVESRGLGLGLFIVQQVVTAHGGAIALSSTLEAGTSFVVRLPRR